MDLQVITDYANSKNKFIADRARKVESSVLQYEHGYLTKGEYDELISDALHITELDEKLIDEENKMVLIEALKVISKIISTVSSF